MSRINASHMMRGSRVWCVGVIPLPGLRQGVLSLAVYRFDVIFRNNTGTQRDTSQP